MGGSHQQDFLAEVQQRREQLALTQKIRSRATSINNTTAVATKKPIPVDDRHALRSLTTLELETLQKNCRCTCSDWSQVSLLVSPASSHVDCSQKLRQLVSNTAFEGTVVLDMTHATITTTTTSTTDTTNSSYKKGPIGIHNNFLISNSIISTKSWVHNNTLISDTHVFPHAVLMVCGSVAASSSGSSFLSNDGVLKVSVGAESGGGRLLTLSPESTMIHVCQQLAHRSSSATTTISTDTPAGDDTAEIPNVNIVSSHCVVRNTPTIQGIYLAPTASIHAATSVSNAILFPTATIQNTCVVQDVRLQWNASIVDNSNVSNTFFMEEAHCGPNSFVASTVLGPDVHVSAGEVHCSVLGPNTNSHHQSLVISVIWPLGRGNVGYGANIGSNHTGRIPDQETTSGEGIFWGLSSVIKFPVDMTMAPYSIVAAGTALPPQRICMPFSLVVGSSEGDSNTIMPGWVLSSSPYTIARSEKKYATRRKAKRHADYTGWKIVRPETVHMCRWARNELRNVAPPNNTMVSPKTLYVTDRVVKGIGSNVLSEKGRLSGIKAYTECIHRFALEGLLTWLVRQHELGLLDDESVLEEEFRSVSQQHVETLEDISRLYEQVEWPIFPWEQSNNNGPDRLWNYQKALLREEFLSNNDDVVKWIADLLETLIVLEKNHADKVYQCKKRDDKRGASTIPGYASSHTAAEIDGVVKEAQATVEEIEATATKLVVKLKQNHRSRL